jgi:hypothetical protein
MDYFDKNFNKLSNGDVINLHQTVNGAKHFVVLNTNPLDIRYGQDIQRKYEYDKEELLSSCKIGGLVEWEIYINLYNVIPQ